MIPKLSAPLIKDIRTGEGILEWLTALLLVVAGATSNLSWAHTGTYLAIVAGVKGARRGLLKIVALQQGAGIGAPIQLNLLSQVSSGIGTVADIAGTVGSGLIPTDVEASLSDIASAEAAAAAAQVEPGLPAEQVSAGLAPEPPAGLGTLPAGVGTEPKP